MQDSATLSVYVLNVNGMASKEKNVKYSRNKLFKFFGGKKKKELKYNEMNNVRRHACRNVEPLDNCEPYSDNRPQI